MEILMNINTEITDDSIREYVNCVQDLLDNKMVMALHNYEQHGGNSRLKHSLNVSYISYFICKKWRFDYVSAARGGLLHDFYLYDWRDTKINKPHKGILHGMIHPRDALKNANEHFVLNKREQDIIRKHMWPLTISLPKYKESYVIMAIDKYCAAAEFLDMCNLKKITKIMHAYT